MKTFATTKSSTSRFIIQSYMIYLMLILAYFFSFFFRVSASVVLPDLALRWGMSASVTGFISSLYFYAYALMQPISGNLNDRFGPLRVVSSGLLVTAVGAAMFGYGTSPLIVGTGRLLTGLGLAPMLSGALVFQASSFAANRYAFFSGITYTMGNLGAVVSVSPLGYALDSLGRGWVFAILAVLNIILASSLLYNYKKDPIILRNVSRGPSRAFSPTLVFHELKKAFGMIIKSSQLRRMSFFWATSAAAILSFQGLWAVSWYKAVYDVSQGAARFWATMIGVGVLAGSFAGAYIAPEAKDRKKAILISGFASCSFWVLLLVCMFFKAPLPMTGLMGFMIGLSVGIAFDHLTAGINDIAEPNFKGSLFGAMNLLTFTGVIIFQMATGSLISLFPSNGGEYSAHGYNVTFLVVAVLTWIAFSGLPGLTSFDTDEKKFSRRSYLEKNIQ